MKKEDKIDFGKIDESLSKSKKELEKAKERTEKLIKFIKSKDISK